MRIRRGLLFWGLFLIPLGAIPLLTRASILDPNALSEAWRLWPLILVGIGLAMVLGRGHAGLLGVSVAGIVLGIAGGSALASGGWIGTFTSCGDTRAITQTKQTDGTFDGPAIVSVDVRCGTVDVTAVPATTWHVDGRYGVVPPTIEATGTKLAVSAPDNGNIGRQEWIVSVPAPELRGIDLRANAASANLRLADASLASVTADVNAADLLIDAGDGSVASIDVTMNAGRARITLGRGPVTGSIHLNAGAVDVCVPADATLHFTVNDQLTFAHNLKNRGLTQAGTTWTRSGSADAIDLRIEGNAASLTLNPEGGCR